MQRVQCILELGQNAHSRDYTHDDDLIIDDIDEEIMHRARDQLAVYNTALQVGVDRLLLLFFRKFFFNKIFSSKNLFFLSFAGHRRHVRRGGRSVAHDGHVHNASE